MGVQGAMNYDRYGLVWVYNGESWVPVLSSTGEQIQYSDVPDVAFPQFSAHEDPSGADPRVMARLERIEMKMDKVVRVLFGSGALRDVEREIAAKSGQEPKGPSTTD